MKYEDEYRKLTRKVPPPVLVSGQCFCESKAVLSVATKIEIFVLIFLVSNIERKFKHFEVSKLH